MSDATEQKNDLGIDSTQPADPQAARALGFVQMLLEKMQMDAEVSFAPDDGEGSADEIRLEIEGPDAGRVIGKRGSVLEAIQTMRKHKVSCLPVIQNGRLVGIVTERDFIDVAARLFEEELRETAEGGG